MKRATIPNLNLPTKIVDYYVVPILDKPYTRIVEAIEQGGKLDMDNFHFCGTTHCIAGWAVHICGLQGYQLEASANRNNELGPEKAAELIFEASSTLKAPPFYQDDYPEIFNCEEEDMSDVVNVAALAKLRELAALEAIS